MLGPEYDTVAGPPMFSVVAILARTCKQGCTKTQRKQEVTLMLINTGHGIIDGECRKGTQSHERARFDSRSATIMVSEPCSKKRMSPKSSRRLSL